MAEEFSWSIAPGTWSALSNMDDSRAYWTFDGDLGQLGTIYEFLLANGYPVVKSNVYPGFPKDQETEYRRALKEIYDRKVPGWWNQYHELLKYQICTKEEYQNHFD